MQVLLLLAELQLLGNLLLMKLLLGGAVATAQRHLRCRRFGGVGGGVGAAGAAAVAGRVLLVVIRVVCGLLVQLVGGSGGRMLRLLLRLMVQNGSGVHRKVSGIMTVGACAHRCC